MWKSYCYCIFCSRERTAEYSLRLLSARKTAFLKKLIPSTQEKRLSFVQVFIIFSKKETLFSFLEKACREIRCPKPEDLKLLKTFIWNQVTWKSLLSLRFKVLKMYFRIRIVVFPGWGSQDTNLRRVSVTF